MKIIDARKHAEELQKEAHELLRAAGAINEACDRQRSVIGYDPNTSEINVADIARGIDDIARKRLMDAIDQARANELAAAQSSAS